MTGTKKNGHYAMRRVWKLQVRHWWITMTQGLRGGGRIEKRDSLKRQKKCVEMKKSGGFTEVRQEGIKKAETLTRREFVVRNREIRDSSWKMELAFWLYWNEGLRSEGRGSYCCIPLVCQCEDPQKSTLLQHTEGMRHCTPNQLTPSSYC